MNHEKIIIVGSGFGGIYTLKNLHKLLHTHGKKVELTLVGENNYFLFTPLLHEVATGGVNPENIIEPVHKVLACALDTFYQGSVKSVNVGAKTVVVGDTTLAYDYLILAPGSQTNFYNIPGAEEYSLPLKSLEDAITIKNRIITQMEIASRESDRAVRKDLLSFIVIGGGPTGVELAAELSEFITETFDRYYSREVIADASVTLVQGQSELLPQFGEKLRVKSLQVLRRKGVTVMLDTKVTEVTDSHIVVQGGNVIASKNVIWVAGIKPREIMFDQEVARAPDGRLITNRFLQLVDHEDIYALGDIASVMDGATIMPLPQLAQVAVKEAKYIAESIEQKLNGKNSEIFVYKNTGNLVSLGQWMALGEIHHFAFWGHITWWMWRTVYLSKLISWQKKVKVAMDWTIGLFSPRDISKL